MSGKLNTFFELTVNLYTKYDKETQEEFDFSSLSSGLTTSVIWIFKYTFGIKWRKIR